MKPYLYSRLLLLNSAKKTPLVAAAIEHLKVLYALGAAAYFNNVQDDIIASYSELVKWTKASYPALEAFNLDKAPYVTALKLLKNGQATSEKFDRVLMEITRDFRGAKIRDIRRNLELSDPQISAYNAIYSLLIKPNERKIDKAIQTVGVLNSPELNKWFSEKVEDQSDLVSDLSNLVKSMTGKDRPEMTLDEVVRIREKRPDEYKIYLQLRRKANKLYKSALRTMVRNSGKELIDAATAKNQLEKNGITINGIPEDFIGKVNEEGKLHTSSGKLLGSQPPANAKITMNPKYDPEEDNGYYIKYLIPGAKGSKPQFSYTVDWNVQQTGKRDQKVEHLAESVETARNKWLADLKSSNHDKKLFGLLAELVYTYQIRVGSSTRNSTDGRTTFGLTTLQSRHIKPRSGNILISYPGKSGVRQRHLIKGNNSLNKLLVKHLTELKTEKSRDFIFKDVKGSRIDSRYLNRYIRSKGLKVTSKDFRRLQGKVLMEQYISSHTLPKNATQSQVTKYIKSGALRVGKALGHRRGVKVKDPTKKYTSATAIKSYIPRPIMHQLYEDRGLRVPRMFRH